jgi:hypothetical protein
MKQTPPPLGEANARRLLLLARSCVRASPGAAPAECSRRQEHSCRRTPFIGTPSARSARTARGPPSTRRQGTRRWESICRHQPGVGAPSTLTATLLDEKTIQRVVSPSIDLTDAPEKTEVRLKYLFELFIFGILY